MITYRQRGLLNLHVIAVTVLAVLWFYVLVEGVDWIPYLALSSGINSASYGAVIAFGMVFSGRSLVRYLSRSHEINWVNAAKITLRQVTLVAFASFGLVFATKDMAMSRLFLGHYLVTLGIVLFFANRRLPGWLAKAVFHEKRLVRTLLVGGGERGVKLADWLRGKEHVGISLAGVLSDERVSGAGLPEWLGAPSELAGVIRAREISQVILLDGAASNARLTDVLEVCQSAGCRLLVQHDFLSKLPVAMNAVVEDGHHFLTVQEEPLEDPLNRLVKRGFDIAVSLPVVVLVLPPLSLAVWLVQRFQSPGAVLFSRPRGGQYGREFLMLKFRSMRVATHDPHLEARQATSGDPRIYPFGHFLRKTSLDEFPQFWNVLKGEMSIVGPRPHLPQHDVEFSSVAKTYRTRQLAKPGITGLAQIRGYRGEITDPELLHRRVQADIEYITNWSIWLDVQITLKTLVHVLAPPPTAR